MTFAYAYCLQGQISVTQKTIKLFQKKSYFSKNYQFTLNYYYICVKHIDCWDILIYFLLNSKIIGIHKKMGCTIKNDLRDDIKINNKCN